MSNSDVPDKFKWLEFDPTRLSISPPEEKEVKTANGVQKYYKIALFYNYGTVKSPTKRPVNGELPEVGWCTWIEKKTEKGYMEKQVCCDLDLLDVDVYKYVHEIVPLWQKTIATLLMPYKGKLGLPKLDITRSEDFIGSPLYWYKDKETGLPAVGFNPRQYIKVGPRSAFIGADGDSFPKELLPVTKFRGRPLLTFTHIYRGKSTDRASPQHTLKSFLITDTESMDNVNAQKDTVKEIQESMPEVVSRYKESVQTQMARLMSKKEEKPEGKPEEKSKDDESDNIMDDIPVYNP